MRAALTSTLEIAAGKITGAGVVRRHLSDLRGTFVDGAAYQQALKQGDPLLYTVSAVEPGKGEGDLHYALGRLMPGRIGREYYMTKGHYHGWRPAAEVYVGLGGEGLMLLQNENGENRLLPFKPETIVYVPGNTAHRTINTGGEPLVYLGIYAAAAGHDYATLAQSNFAKIIVEQNGVPVMIDRAAYKG